MKLGSSPAQPGKNKGKNKQETEHCAVSGSHLCKHVSNIHVLSVSLVYVQPGEYVYGSEAQSGLLYIRWSGHVSLLSPKRSPLAEAICVHTLPTRWLCTGLFLGEFKPFIQQRVSLNL